MKKILIATGIYPPDIGGPATYSKLLMDELPKRGFEVAVLSFGSVRHLPKLIRHLVYAWRLACLVKNHDLILAQDAVSVGLPAVIVSKILRKKFIVRVPGDYAWEQATQRFGVKETIDEFQKRHYGLRVEVFRFIQSSVVKQANWVITPSNYFRELVSGWGRPLDKITAIYNGIELASHDGTNKPWEQKENIIVSAGRLVPWKGFSGLVLLIGLMPDWHLDIVGEGPDRGTLEEQAKKLGVADQVRFLGAISRPELFALFGQAKIFVLNTSFESFSFQVVEAMNSGIPVVTTRIGSLPELITDQESGFLVSPDDFRAIQRAIEQIDCDKQFRERLIMAARQKARTFSIQTTLDNLEKIIREL